MLLTRPLPSSFPALSGLLAKSMTCLAWVPMVGAYGVWVCGSQWVCGCVGVGCGVCGCVGVGCVGCGMWGVACEVRGVWAWVWAWVWV